MELLRMLCNCVETEPVLQDLTGEELNRGANTAPDVRLDIIARGFWERQRSAFFDVRVLPSKCRLLSRFGSRSDIQAVRNREEAPVR